MSKVTIIVGMPSSGKTSYINEHSETFGDALICDDYHDTSDKRFEGSPYYNKLVCTLKEGRDVVITDIIFCKRENLKFIIDSIKELASELKIDTNIEVIYFENNPEICKKNVIPRMKRPELEISLIDELSNDYEIPEGAKTIPVWKN